MSCASLFRNGSWWLPVLFFGCSFIYDVDNLEPDSSVVRDVGFDGDAGPDAPSDAGDDVPSDTEIADIGLRDIGVSDVGDAGPADSGTCTYTLTAVPAMDGEPAIRLQGSPLCPAGMYTLEDDEGEFGTRMLGEGGGAVFPYPHDAPLFGGERSITVSRGEADVFTDTVTPVPRFERIPHPGHAAGSFPPPLDEVFGAGVSNAGAVVYNAQVRMTSHIFRYAPPARLAAELPSTDRSFGPPVVDDDGTVVAVTREEADTRESGILWAGGFRPFRFGGNSIELRDMDIRALESGMYAVVGGDLLSSDVLGAVFGPGVIALTKLGFVSTGPATVALPLVHGFDDDHPSYLEAATSLGARVASSCQADGQVFVSDYQTEDDGNRLAFRGSCGSGNAGVWTVTGPSFSEPRLVADGATRLLAADGSLDYLVVRQRVGVVKVLSADAAGGDALLRGWDSMETTQAVASLSVNGEWAVFQTTLGDDSFLYRVRVFVPPG